MVMCQYKLLILMIKISGSIQAAVPLASNDLVGLATHFQESVFLHNYDCKFDDYDFQLRCDRLTFLFFLKV